MKSYRLEVYADTHTGVTVLEQGTAWPISGETIVTAFHVVADATKKQWRGDEVAVGYRLFEDDQPVKLEPIACDRIADVALLRREPAADEAPPERWRPFLVGEWGAGKGVTWEAAGFAIVAEGKTLTLHGSVKQVASDGDAEDIELFVAEGGTITWSGASGSPICVDGAVVGVLTTEVGGTATLYAASIEAVLRLQRQHRLAASDEFREACVECLLRACSTVEALQALQDELPLAPWPAKDDPRALASATVSRAALFGVEGLAALLACLTQRSGGEAVPLLERINQEVLQGERKRWSSLFPTRREPLHRGHAPPEMLMTAWREFVQSASWDHRVRENLQALAGILRELRADEAFIRRVDEFETRRTYQIVRGELVDLLRDERLTASASSSTRAYALPRRVQTLGALWYLASRTTPLGCCFLVMGSSGSGKTHFVDAIVAESSSREAPLVLPVGLPDKTPDSRDAAEAAVLNALQSATGRRFKDLAEFQQTLTEDGLARVAYARRVKLVSQAPPQRVVIAIDDLQRWFPDSSEGTSRVCDALERLVAAHTSLPSIRWLVTLHHTSYDRLPFPTHSSTVAPPRGAPPHDNSNTPSFWDEYGSTPRPRAARPSRPSSAAPLSESRRLWL